MMKVFKYLVIILLFVALLLPMLPSDSVLAFVEEQTYYNCTIGLRNGSSTRAGENLTISDRCVTSLSFVLQKYGSPTGNVTFTIRKVSDDSILGSGVWGDASNVETSAAWHHLSFSSGVYVNESVRIAVEFSGGDVFNKIYVWHPCADVKSGEVFSYYFGGAWHDFAAEDLAYKYTYVTTLPNVTTHDATYVSRTTARLNSYLDDDGGGGSEPCDVRFQYDKSTGGGTGNTSENQTNYDSINNIYTGLWTRAGQTLNITNRTVTGLSFPLKKVGAPTGDVNFTIRYTGNDTLINSVTWGDASSLATSAQWKTASFAVPVVVNASVHILVEFYSGDASKYVQYHHEDSNEKNNEFFTHYNGAYTNHTTYDGAYKYYYGTGGYGNSTPWVNDTYVTGDSPYLDISSLDVNTTYYFRVQAKNTIGTTNGSELNFTTYPNIFEPTNFAGYPSSTSIGLVFTKGVNAANTMIRGKAGSYPANETDGKLVYAGTMATATDTGLSPGTTYYYRSWSFDGAGYSANYTDFLMTTTAYSPTTNDTPTTPLTPSTWWGIPDYTNLENLGGLYTFINGIADQYQIPYNTFWMSLIIIMIMSTGLFIYSVQHNATVALGIVSVLIVIAAIAGLLPMLLIALIVIPAGGIMMVKRRI